MKKETTKKVVEVEALPLVTYTMRATIRTGDYSNIQPEVTVMAKTLQEASDQLLPHMDMLYAKYFDFMAPKASPAKQPAPLASVTKPAIDTANMPFEAVHEMISQNKSDAYLKAESAIKSCQNVDAIELISTRIGSSKTLNDNEKRVLMVEIEAKKNGINGK